MSFLERKGLLDSCQSGFRKGKTTYDQLIRLTQSIVDGYQRKEATLAVFVDLKQAYDSVWKPGLLMKMLDLGVRSNMYGWIKDFIRDRSIQTKVGDHTSNRATLEMGLPQGSAISCSLFLIFINDLGRYI